MVGLGPAGAELLTAQVVDLVERAERVFLRTVRHPAAAVLGQADSFDHHYEQQPTFEAVYQAIVADLIATALRDGPVVYAVPGSPMVAERTVVLLREAPAVVAGEVDLAVHPALSFLELAFDRLGVDPVASGVRIVDGETFGVDAAGERGPLLVAQCWSRSILSEVKLSVDWRESGTSEPVVTVLHHLGMADEVVRDVRWDELDRSFDPDHLTALWIPTLSAPVAPELVRLDELMHTLRHRCPWDREQTHGSLARHLLEESYEVLEAIDALAAVDAAQPAGAGWIEQPVGAEQQAVADLEEELGDLLFQILFHATLAEEAGRFTLADVARGIHDKLVARHAHLFDHRVEAPERLDVAWETQKKAEKHRSSVTDGIPAALPALALAAKLQRKGSIVGMRLAGFDEEVARVSAELSALADAVHAGGESDDRAVSDGESRARSIGELLFSVVNLARVAGGVDPEAALRVRASAFRAEVQAQE